MSYNYALHPDAQGDYEISFKWYLERSEAAANNFTEAIEAALQLIWRTPYMWANKYKHFYEYTLRKYPFTIIYSIEKEKRLVVIFAVFHHKRKPQKKYGKSNEVQTLEEPHQM